MCDNLAEENRKLIKCKVKSICIIVLHKLEVYTLGSGW